MIARSTWGCAVCCAVFKTFLAVSTAVPAADCRDAMTFEPVSPAVLGADELFVVDPEKEEGIYSCSGT